MQQNDQGTAAALMRPAFGASSARGGALLTGGIVVVALVALVALGRPFGGGVSTSPGNVATIWAANSVFATLLILTPTDRWWPAIGAGLAGFFCGDLWIGLGPWLSLAYSGANVLECVLLAALVLRFARPRSVLTSTRGVITYVAISLAASLVGGGLGTAATALAVPGVPVISVLGSWVISDFGGHIVITPLLLALRHDFIPAFWDAPAARKARLIGLVIASGLLASAPFVGNSQYGYALLFAPLPFLVWAALAFGSLGATLAAGATTLVVLTETVLGNGVFTGLGAAVAVTSLQIFIISVTFSCLLLAAATSERDHAVVNLTALRRDLEASNRQLTQANRQQAEFTYALSHDLMSPVNTMRMGLSELQQYSDAMEPEERQDIIADTLVTAERMSGLISGLLSYSGTIGPGLEVSHVDLRQEARAVVKDLAADIEATGAAVRIGPLPVIRANPWQMRMLLQNLIANAIKFRAPGRPATVELGVDQPGGEDAVTLFVQDNGIGIPPEQHDRVFGLFNRLHAPEAYEGHGIGLALCQRIASNHGGSIGIAPGLDVGTRFVVTLPASARTELCADHAA